MNGSIFQNLSQNWLIFKKILEKLVILFKIWPKIGPIGIWMGYFFLKKWYLYMGLLSNSVAAHIPTKTKLEYPPRVGAYPLKAWDLVESVNKA